MQPTQAINPFQQVLDDEAYQLLTKCDPKLGVAVLSLALKKFSEKKEFLYFLKPEYRNEFENKVIQEEAEEVNGKEQDISMNTNNQLNNQSNNQSTTTNQPQESPTSAIAVAW